MVAHQRDEHRDIALVKTQPRPDARHELHSGVGVVTGVALAEVVQPRAHEQQVGPGHAPGEGGGAGDRLTQMPVHGEPVVRVALRPAAHGLPFRQDAHEQASLIERLEHRDGGGTRAQQGEQGLAGVVRPRVRAAIASRPGACHRQPVQGGARDGSAGLGRGGSQPEQQHPVTARIDVGRERHLAVAEHDARSEGVIAAGDATGRTAQRRPDASPGVVARPGDETGRGRDLAHQRVGVGEPQCIGYALLLLQKQPVARLSGPSVQLDPHCEEGVVGAGQRLIVTLEQDAARHLRPTDGVDVA
jgi:hypothetical protein